MSTAALDAIRDLIQEDVGNRGLRTDPESNLITSCAGDFAAAGRSLAETPDAALAVVTGFFIPHGQPPGGETDGPLGALFLARALVPLGIRVVLATDAFCQRALEVGLAACGLRKAVPLVILPSAEQAGLLSLSDYGREFATRAGPLTHLLALERVGPSHTPESIPLQIADLRLQIDQSAIDGLQSAFLAEVPAEHHDRCHTMRGRDITLSMSPAHRLFEPAGRPQPGLTTIGVGDGGNEIGMGKVPWEVIRRNIPRGGLVACRVPADYLIVCGVSNWGAYGLAAGVRLLRGQAPDPELFDPERERELLSLMVEQGALVEGVTGQRAVAVDGLTFERYAEPLRRLGTIG
jgi:hypothetical protein